MPKAKLVPLTTTKKTYVHGAGRGKWRGIKAILDRPLREDILAAFYGAIVPSEKVL